MSTATRPPAVRSAVPGAEALPRTVPAPRAPLRAVHTARRLPDAPFIDRLMRGRLWVALIAAALMGMVFLQVSMLELNAGIGRAVDREQALMRQNARLRAEVSGLASGERIREAAAGLGMVAPPAGEVSFLEAGDPAAARRAVANVMAPTPQATDTAARGATPEIRAAAAAEADAPPGTTAATGAPRSGPSTLPAQAAAASAQAAGSGPAGSSSSAVAPAAPPTP